MSNKKQNIDLNNIITNPLYLSLARNINEINAIKSVTISNINGNYNISGTIRIQGIETYCNFEIDKYKKVTTANVDNTNIKSDEQYIYLVALIEFVNNLDEKDLKHNEIILNDQYEAKKTKLANIEEQIYLKSLDDEVRSSRNLIDKYKIHYQTELTSQLNNNVYELEPVISIDSKNYLEVTYKIGTEKKYIIKDISKFIGYVDNNELYKYGKNFSLVHSEEIFDEESLNQFKMLKEAVNLKNTKSHKDDYFYRNDYTIHRYFPIDTDLIDMFFETYKGVEGYNFECVDSDELINITIDETKYSYIYKIGENIKGAFKGKLHLYKATKTMPYVITRYELDNKAKALSLITELFDHDITVLKEEDENFRKYVLNDLVDYLDFPESEVEDDTFNRIKLFGDINEKNVIMRLEYLNNENDLIKAFSRNHTTTFNQDLVESYLKEYSTHLDVEESVAYFDLDKEKTYEFLDIGLNKINDIADVYISKELKNIEQKHHYSVRVGVSLSNDLLKINFDSDEIQTSELSDVLKAYRKKKKFYKLKSGELINLNSSNIDELNNFVIDYQIPLNEINKKIEMPTYRMITLDNDKVNFENLTFIRNKMFETKMAEINNSKDIDYTVPKHLDKVLRDYQIDGFKWLKFLQSHRFNGILADDMGLGKTLQIISIFASENDSKNLVVCPASLVYNWQDEIIKFSSDLKTLCITGSEATRNELIKEIDNYDVIITSYDYIRRDISKYSDIEFDYLVIDEAQNIKNHKTKNAASVKKIKAKNKVALSGTPIENSLAELWSIFDFLMPGYLYNYNYFNKTYETDIVKNNNLDKLNRLRELVSPFILRRHKSNVLLELPDKIEKDYLIDFNEDEKNLYQAYLVDINKQLQKESSNKGSEKLEILAMLTKLRQLCCDRRLLFDNVYEPSSKLKACIDLIQTLRENNQKVLLFSNFTTMLDLIKQELDKNKISNYMLTGKTSKEKRKELVDSFQNDDTEVFLISLRAGGTGLNLTAAQAVIHFDPWWNSSAKNQATDRAYRIGQEKNVQVFNLVMKDSIEEKILELQNKKKQLSDSVVENNDNVIAQMSKEELMDLFK
ncbi:SNF2-related protein [Mycoplasma sp. P36-A1]|uniref:DEAD/DEAH box helicase n=1 Tax=Mycoplasma sp. P36-A1 TaxID=3252900 RepID=UPI003C2EF2BC